MVLNETAACYNNYGRQSLFYKIQASLQGTMLLRINFPFSFANWLDYLILTVLLTLTLVPKLPKLSLSQSLQFSPLLNSS